MRTDFWEREPLRADLAAADRVCVNKFQFDTHWEMERTHEAVHFPEAIAWDETPNGDPEWVFAMNRLTFLVTLGQAWQETKSEKYGEAAARLFVDWMDRVSFTEESKKTTWRPIEAGIRCENLLRMLALFQDCPAFPVALQDCAETSIRQHGEWLMEAHGPFQRLSNWGVIQNHGLFLAGLALEEMQWCQTAAKRLTEAVQTQVFPDGSHWEQSPLYHCEVLRCCLDTMQAADAAEYTLPRPFLAKTRAMARALKQWCRPDGLLLCQSDTDEIDARDIMTQASRLFLDSFLAHGSAGQSVALPDSGNTMLWDSAGENAGFLHFHCGCLGSGHGHADLLHVDLVAEGETILADSGRYTYVESPLRKQLKRPAAHNTVLVDGQDFTTYVNTWEYGAIAEPVKGEYRFTPQADYACGGHLGYLGLGVVLRRRVLRLGKGLWVLVDEAAATEGTPHIYQRFFHFGSEGRAEADGQGAVFQGRRAAARLVLPDEGLTLAMSRQPLSRQYNLLEEGDCLAATASREGNASLVAVMATGKAGHVPELAAERLPVSLQKDGKTLPKSHASGLRIRHEGQEWTVILCHGEVISQVDLLEADGKTGYGKVLVFGPDCENGLGLAF